MSSFLFFFGSFFLAGSLSWEGFLGFWLCLEAATLVVIPCFFNYSHSYNRYASLLNYILGSGLSSVLLLAGVYLGNNNLLFLLAFSIKLGLYPFYSWVVIVYNNVSWSFLFYLGVVSKLFLFYICKLSIGSYWVACYNLLCLFTFCFVAFFYIFSTFSLKTFYALSSLLSSCVLGYVSLLGEASLLILLYSVYSLISGVFLSSLYLLENGRLEGVLGLKPIFFLLGIPFSVVMLYKFISVTILLSLGSFFILCGFVLCSIVEQFYISLYFINKVFF